MQNIPSLIILDLLGNPLVHESSNYRLFLIYHLQSLKALDGVAVVSFWRVRNPTPVKNIFKTCLSNSLEVSSGN